MNYEVCHKLIDEVRNIRCLLDAYHTGPCVAEEPHMKDGYARTILTADGDYFDFLSPNPAVVTINAIARGLANTCRFAGQCDRFYSVAEHSIIASRLVSPELAVQALLHDAAEAFMCDMPKPLKVMLPDYQRFEAIVEAVIFPKFGFSELDPQIKHVDKIMLVTEQRQLMRNNHAWKYTAGVEPADIELEFLSPDAAFDRFLTRAEELGLS